MKKSFVYYLICWVFVVVLFNVVSFVTPSNIAGHGKYSGGFWVGYVFITLCFIGHLAFSYFSLSENNKEKRVLNVPLNIISYIELVIMVVAGVLCMITPFMPVWFGVIICMVVLVFSIISLVGIKGVSEHTSEANINLNNKTESFREMVDLAQIVCSIDKEENKAVATKVYESIYYSDSIASTETAEIDIKIKNSLISLKEYLNANNESDFKSESEKILRLVEERKVICMSAKRKA